MAEATEAKGSKDASPIRSLEGELVALIAANAQRSQYLTLLGASIPVIVLVVHVRYGWPLVWGAALAVAVTVRTRLVLAWQGDAALDDAAKISRLRWLYTCMAGMQSLVMAFFPIVPVSIGAMLTMYLVGMTSGMVPSVAGCRRLVQPYTLIVMGTIASAWSLLPPEGFGLLDRVLFFGMSMMYAKVMLDYGDTAFRVFADGYRIRMERIALNQQLRDALDRAEAASRAKTRFLASASHDLRQPIHALSLFSGSLLLRDLDARSTGIAVQLDKSVAVLSSQLDALLDISRLDAGVVERSVTTIELHALLTQLGDEFAEQVQRKSLRLDVQCDTAVRVRSDPVLLRRVLANLVSNAIKYTESGSVQIGSEVRDGLCRVRVCDTGPGIPESERERVFEEFYQLQNPERDRTRGLGLGLAIVRRLCALLSLRLTLESSVGRGTTFCLELPLADPDQSPSIVPMAVAPGVQRMPVLVVDDEEDVRVGMQTLLEEMGFSVCVAASTLAALDCVRTFSPSLVLADFRLRGSDNGIETIRALRRDRPGLPALLVSGDTAPDRLREARDAGIELLHKPVSPSQLRESILRVTAA